MHPFLLIAYFLFFCAPSLYAFDFPETEVQAYPCAHCAQLDSSPLSLSWPITDKKFIKKPVPHQQKSTAYQIKTDFAVLKKGIVFETAQDGALLRFITDNKLSADMFLLYKNGNAFSLQQLATTANAQELSTSPFRKTALMAKFGKNLGHGQFILRAKKTAPQQGAIIIQVDDLYSSIVLDISTDKAFYKSGETVTITLQSVQYDQQTTEYVKVYAHSPQGIPYPVFLKEIADHIYQGQFALTDIQNPKGENWYIDAEEESMFHGNSMLRRAHSAFSYAIPSAAIRSIEPVEPSFHFQAKINAAIASRFVLQAVLLGSAENGRLIPLQLAQSAAFLFPGENRINFSFAPENKQLVHAPFYLGAIQLLDYGQIKSVFEYNTPILIKTN